MRQLLVTFLACSLTYSAIAQDAVLIFSRTKGYRHASIGAGKRAIMTLGAANKFRVDTTEDAALFTLPNLKRYKAVVFLSTTGNVLDSLQQIAFEQYIRQGGGYMGIHAAADTEYDWPWYNQLCGAWFLSHPKQQNAEVVVIDKKNPSTSMLPDRWKRFDEWYSYKNIVSGPTVLAMLDEKTYEGGKNGDNHPIAWCRKFEGGRSFYTGMGHTDESYVDPLFVAHLLGGLQWTMGKKK